MSNIKRSPNSLKEQRDQQRRKLSGGNISSSTDNSTPGWGLFDLVTTPANDPTPEVHSQPSDPGPSFDPGGGDSGGGGASDSF